MNNLFRVVAVLVGMLASSSVSAQCGPQGCAAPADLTPRSETVDQGRCAERAAGECWCKYSRQVPEYYCCPRCVEQTIPCTKKACRYVKQYYDVQRCRMVPEYYTETYCKEVPEYYDVPDCKTCKTWVNDTKCRYRTEYYWKKTCNNECVPKPCCAPCNPCCN